MAGDLQGKWQAIKRRLGEVARPDSRFDLDLERFIPAFEGLESATAQAISTREYAKARIIFATPDNSIQLLRYRALHDGKVLVVPTYGLHRGFVQLDPVEIGTNRALYASWGDGIQHFGQPLALQELGPRLKVDLIVAGAAAVAANGVRFGMGHRYLDLEWNIFRKAGMVSDETPVWTIVHDEQVLDEELDTQPDGVTANAIFTPTRALRLPLGSRPTVLQEATIAALFASASEPLGLRRAVNLGQHLNGASARSVPDAH